MNELLIAILEDYYDEEILKADGFDEAIIGIDPNSVKLVYSIKKCIEILMRDMTDEDAREYFNFNVLGAYIGEKTPIFCDDEYS